MGPDYGHLQLAKGPGQDIFSDAPQVQRLRWIAHAIDIPSVYIYIICIYIYVCVCVIYVLYMYIFQFIGLYVGSKIGIVW